MSAYGMKLGSASRSAHTFRANAREGSSPIDSKLSAFFAPSSENFQLAPFAFDQSPPITKEYVQF